MAGVEGAAGRRGIWQGSHWAYRLPVFIAYMAFIVLTMFWPTPRNLAQVIAAIGRGRHRRTILVRGPGRRVCPLVSAVVLLMVFRPNLSDVRPPVPPAVGRGLAVRALALWYRLRRREPARVAA